MECGLATQPKPFELRRVGAPANICATVGVRVRAMARAKVRALTPALIFALALTPTPTLALALAPTLTLALALALALTQTLTQTLVRRMGAQRAERTLRREAAALQRERGEAPQPR